MKNRVVEISMTLFFVNIDYHLICYGLILI